MVDEVVVLARGVSFIAMFQAAGGAVFLTLFGTQLPICGARILRLLRIAAIVAVLLVLVQFGSEAARLAGEFSGLWDESMQKLAWHSAPGGAVRLRLSALLLVLAGLLIYPRPLGGKGPPIRIRPAVRSRYRCAGVRLHRHRTHCRSSASIGSGAVAPGPSVVYRFLVRRVMAVAAGGVARGTRGFSCGSAAIFPACRMDRAGAAHGGWGH